MPELLKRLFEYDYWANCQVVKNLESIKAKEEPLKYFGHALGSQKIWLARLHGEDTAGKSPWFKLTVEECKSTVEELKAEWARSTNGLINDKLSEKIIYRNPQGKEFESRIGDILTHVIIHSAYHRAQAAMATRSSGEEPAITDFIRFARSQ